METKTIPRDPAGVDAWLLEQWTRTVSEISHEAGSAPEVSADEGPVYPAGKLYAVADYIMRDSKGRISKKRAMETLEMIREYQCAARSR